MTEQTFKQKDAQRHRIKYWFQKCVAVGLIPHTLDTEDKLRAMCGEWQASRGKPVIPGKDLKPTEMQGTSVGEFYKVKKSFEKKSDQAWVRELRKGERSGSTEVPDSTKIQRIEAGESLLIFGISSPKTQTFPMKSDSDQYIRDKKLKQKKKSSWNF